MNNFNNISNDNNYLQNYSYQQQNSLPSQSIQQENKNNDYDDIQAKFLEYQQMIKREQLFQEPAPNVQQTNNWKSENYYQSSNKFQDSYKGGKKGFFEGNKNKERGNKYFKDIPNDTIYISGLTSNISEDDLAERFGSIGIIKTDKKTGKPRINIYKDKETGGLKGDAIITFDDPETTNAAIKWFDGKELKGAILHVELAQKKENNIFGKGRGKGYKNFGRNNNEKDNEKRDNTKVKGRGPPIKSEGDWNCPSCNNLNWARRTACNKCNEKKPEHEKEHEIKHYSQSSHSHNNQGKFNQEDWKCPECQNLNWARRTTCNKCNLPKPGMKQEHERSKERKSDHFIKKDYEEKRNYKEENKNKKDSGRDSGRDKIAEERRERRDKPY